jgi:hypothetical protein
MEVSGQLQSPAAFLSEKEPPVPMDKKLGGPQSRSGRSGKERTIFSSAIPGIKPVKSGL